MIVKLVAVACMLKGHKVGYVGGLPRLLPDRAVRTAGVIADYFVRNSSP